MSTKSLGAEHHGANAGHAPTKLSATSSPTNTPTARPRVLIVEDEGIVALDLRQRLVRLGYDVPETAASGERAIQAASRHLPDVVLMDIHLQGRMDGIEAAQEIAEVLHLPVIYLTAYSEETTLARARATRPYGYLLKPFTERELHASIQVAIERHRVDQAVLASEIRLRMAVEAARLHIWQMAPGDSHLHWYGGEHPTILATDTLQAIEALVGRAHADPACSVYCGPNPIRSVNWSFASRSPTVRCGG
jgi:CheY-like chemotaxis protein